MRQMCNNCTWKLKTKTFQCSTFLLLPLPKNRLTHCQCDACCLCFSPLNSSVPFPRGMHNTWNAQDIFQISFYLLCIYFWMHSHSPTLNKIKWALLSWTLVFLLYKLNLKKNCMKMKETPLSHSGIAQKVINWYCINSLFLLLNVFPRVCMKALKFRAGMQLL